MTWSQSSPRRSATLALALCGLVYFLCTDFRKGWIQSTTDFPNYYTAARLARSGKPLRNFYDWTWFQRQMNYAGIETQLGAYTPQPPLTMLPMLPIAGFAPQVAKRIWLIFNLFLLGYTAWLLSKLGSLPISHVMLLILTGYTSLRSNFVLGQYYVFLLFLLTLTFYLIARSKPASSGVVAGIAFALKLYGGPLLLYFVAKRYWKAVASMAGATFAMAIIAIVIFGWVDVWFYATQILPRTLEGVPPDPYNPGIQVVATLLRRLFMADPELNPHPFYNAPALFFFLQPLISLTIVIFAALAVALNRVGTCGRDFAIFTIALFLISTSVASYTFLLLLLPIVLCLKEAGRRESLFLISCYILLNAPLPAARLFPKVWLLLALLLIVGRRYWASLRPSLLVGALACCVAVAALKARSSLADYERAPDKRNQLLVLEKGSLFVTFPTVSRAGLFCQVQRRDRYVLRWLHDTTAEDLAFEGEAFHPFVLDPNGPIYFELVAHGASTLMQFDPFTRKAAPAATSVNIHPNDSPLSPDGRHVAFTSDRGGSQQIFLRDLANGRVSRLTGGNCNNSEPAWDLNSNAIVFASDCGRAVGLSAIYRVDVAALPNP